MGKELKKIDQLPAPIAPMLPMPELLQSAMPVPVPQMDWNSGVIRDFFHNWKLKRIERASDREATIAEHKNRYVKSSLDTIEAITTFSARLELNFRQKAHDIKMLEIDEQKGQAELINIQLKNQLLHSEVQLNEIELKIKMKELKEILDGSTET